MAEILKGKRKGEEVKLHQWCNNWFMLEDGTIVSPTSIRLSAKEILKVVEYEKEKRNGIMFNLFTLDTIQGTFKKRKF